MSASNKPQLPQASSFAGLPVELADAVAGLWHGSIGHTVRCVPTRRTVTVGEGAARLFGKWRLGHRRGAAAEWRWLHLLPMLGLSVPAPVIWLGQGRRTLLVTMAVPGRAMDAWIVEAASDGWLPQLADFACRRIAPIVRRLHDHGLVYRDLYWNHVFVDDPRAGGAVALVDVERVLRPLWWPRRWVVKDLAGLLSSCPVPVPTRVGLRFLRACLGGPLRDHRRMITDVVRKAGRIRRHVPRYG
ncbi:MAG: lipopolysaccharide kinase InaA family protein [Planctomycetota bacterium]|nr:lipopolysaccharide kinase InaA family protein [Planctomycetota bacterium]